MTCFLVSYSVKFFMKTPENTEKDLVDPETADEM